MYSHYTNLSAEELRQMFLNSELKHSKMSERDYTVLLELELNEGENLNMELIKFCSDGLGCFEKYKELDDISIDIGSLIKKHNNSRPISLRVALVAAIMIIAIFTTQVIGLAFGIDIIGHLFNWGEEKLEIVPVFNENIITADENSFKLETTEPIRYVFESETEIPNILNHHCDVLKNLGYQFDVGRYLSDGVSTLTTIHFIKEETDLRIEVTKNIDIDIEKDNEFYEEYLHDSTVYHLFKNLEYYKVVWNDSEYIYHLNINLPVDEVKSIIHNF